MPKIMFIGTESQTRYVGDGLLLQVGNVIEVSDEKKKQLKKDHPDWFKFNPKEKDITKYSNKMISSSPQTKTESPTIPIEETSAEESAGAFLDLED